MNNKEQLSAADQLKKPPLHFYLTDTFIVINHKRKIYFKDIERYWSEVSLLPSCVIYELGCMAQAEKCSCTD